MKTKSKETTSRSKEFWISIRSQAVCLRKKKMTFREIAKTLKISVGCAVNACKRKAELNRFTDRHRSGRPRKTTERQDRYIEKLALADRRKNARKITVEVSKN